MIKNKGNRKTNAIISILFWMAFWTVLSLLIGKELILPTPWAVLKRLVELMKESSFWWSSLKTVARIAGGFLSGLLAGVIFAILSYCFEWVKILVSPMIRMIRAIPVASFIVLVMLWVKTDLVPLFIASLIVLPIVYTETLTGIENTDTKMIEVGKVFRFSLKKKLKYIYIPSVSSYLVSSSLTALGLAFKSGIAAEVIALPKNAIGTEIYNSKVYLETADLFAWTLVIVVLCYFVEKLLSQLIKGRKENP